ncbi:MAG: SPFH domain-containing protein [Lachnospiraceae bacterium]|jgi:membrane protease subunit (stomatin/prohibitin family)|nr:SPFH domain-containing protein [Lachnospiraceae bacterium]
MGLIKAIVGAAGSSLADSWRDYFYCEALETDVLVTKGVKRVGEKSSNTKASDNIISNGSVIAVNEGQCMILVDQGKVSEVCAEPGEFTYDTSTEPSLFYGKLGEQIVNTFKQIGRRFTFGGDTAKDQRIYYVNTKEILGNKYGTQNPVPFRVIDRNIGLDVDVTIRVNGEYSYRIVDPILFYTNVCANVPSDYRRDAIDSMLKTELLTALQPAFAKLSEQGVRYSMLPAHTTEIAQALNEILSAQWRELRGIAVASFGINSVTAPPEDEEMIKELQKTAVLRDPSMAAATLVGAQSEAMKGAANNAGGAMLGFMGLSMAQTAGGANAQNLYNMGQTQGGQVPPAGAVPPQGQTSAGVVGGVAATAPATWTCECGKSDNIGNFCQECGKPKPAVLATACPKCGWQVTTPGNPPKFCPECGEAFPR